jgi:hypothetical protein
MILPTILSHATGQPGPLAGLGFVAGRSWCYFRASCGFTFERELAPQGTYVVVDPETNEAIGIQTPEGFSGSVPFTPYRVYLLLPAADVAASL